jgi:magnesium chelatase subunit H
VKLRKTPPKDRQISLLVYGFPPNVGATATAALLNVGRSLKNVFGSLARSGYDLGGKAEYLEDDWDEKLLEALRFLSQDFSSSLPVTDVISKIRAIGESLLCQGLVIADRSF